MPEFQSDFEHFSVEQQLSLRSGLSVPSPITASSGPTIDPATGGDTLVITWGDYQSTAADIPRFR